MTKTELKITGMSHPRYVKTVVDVLPTLDSIQRTKVNPRKVASVSLSFISGILIVLCSIVGCSDMPYTGSMMTTDDIDQYIVSPNDDLICLQNGTDSECLTLIPKDTQKADSIINGPIIHIYPERLVYVFYHEGKKIVRAEKIMDTTEIVETLTEPKEYPPPPTDELTNGSTQQPPPQTDDQSRGSSGDDPFDDNSNGDDPQPSDPPQPQDPPNSGTQQPPQTTNPPGGTGTAGNNPNANNNPDDTPPPPQISNPPGGTGSTTGNNPNANNNPDDTPPQNDDPPGGSIGDDPDDNNNNNNGDDTPPPPPPLPPRTPPPPPLLPQTNNQPRSNSNPNTGGDNSQDSTVSHQTPNAIYYDDDPVGKWYVTIYYPDNYIGDKTEGDYGFTISSSNGEIDFPGTLTRNGVRFPITIGEGMLYVTVAWSTDPTDWEEDSDPPPRHYLIQARRGGTHRIQVTME